jgi:L-ascorbate peroxidase
MKYGRVDVTGPDECPPEGNLPGAAGPFDDAAGSNPFPGAADPQTHLRNIFHRMGFDDAEIVALSGAHTIGAPALAILAVATTAARSVPPASASASWCV